MDMFKKLYSPYEGMNRYFANLKIEMIASYRAMAMYSFQGQGWFYWENINRSSSSIYDYCMKIYVKDK